jgi:hypothetical protein
MSELGDLHLKGASQLMSVLGGQEGAVDASRR